MGFKERIQQMKKELMRSHESSFEHKDDKGLQYGSIFIKEKIPEGVGFWRPEAGVSHIVDIIPWPAGSNHPQFEKGHSVHVLDLWIYQRVGPTNEVFVAPAPNFKKADPIAEYIKREGGSAFRKNRAKRRCFYWVWVHDSVEEEEKGPQLWDVAHFFFEDPVTEISVLPRGGGMQLYTVPDKEDGKSVMFTVKASGKFTDDEGKERDSISFVGHKFVERETNIPEKYIDFVGEHPIDDMVNMHPTYKEIYEAFYQKKYVDLDGDSQDQPVISRKAKEQKLEEDECPGGGSFGVSVNTLPECKSCPNWEGCETAFNEKEDKAKRRQEEETKEKEVKEEPDLEEKETKPVVKKRKLLVRKRG